MSTWEYLSKVLLQTCTLLLILIWAIHSSKPFMWLFLATRPLNLRRPTRFPEVDLSRGGWRNAASSIWSHTRHIHLALACNQTCSLLITVCAHRDKHARLAILVQVSAANYHSQQQCFPRSRPLALVDILNVPIVDVIPFLVSTTLSTAVAKRRVSTWNRVMYLSLRLTYTWAGTHTGWGGQKQQLERVRANKPIMVHLDATLLPSNCRVLCLD